MRPRLRICRLVRSIHPHGQTSLPLLNDITAFGAGAGVLSSIRKAQSAAQSAARKNNAVSARVLPTPLLSMTVLPALAGVSSARQPNCRESSTSAPTATGLSAFPIGESLACSLTRRTAERASLLPRSRAHFARSLSWAVGRWRATPKILQAALFPPLSSTTEACQSSRSTGLRESAVSARTTGLS